MPHKQKSAFSWFRQKKILETIVLPEIFRRFREYPKEIPGPRAAVGQSQYAKYPPKKQDSGRTRTTLAGALALS